MGFDIRPRIRRAFRLALRRRDLTAAEVDEELRFHIQSRIDQLVARGLTREQARPRHTRASGRSGPRRSPDCTTRDAPASTSWPRANASTRGGTTCGTRRARSGVSEASPSSRS
jgi:hypothetical protein